MERYYVSQPVAARILGVSRQRVQQLLIEKKLGQRLRFRGGRYIRLRHDVRLDSVLNRARVQGRLDEAIKRLMQMTDDPSLHKALVKYLNSGGFNNDQQN